MDAEKVGPLEGLRVIELGTILAASFATRLLADMGAEVVKIETRDRPDPMRHWGRGQFRGRALWWPIQVRNKSLATLDLRQTEGQEVFRRLCRTTDVVIENLRPGTLEKWNLGYDVLAAENPRLILARISGYGQTGPYAQRPGYAAVAEAVGGLRYINGFPDQPPPRSGISLGDSLAGMFAANGVLAALYERQTSGRGQVIDVSLAESCLALMESTIAEYDRLGVIREPSGTRLPGVSPSNIYRSKDGHWFVIAANQDQIFARLCAAMGRPELAIDPRFSTHVGRAENQDELEDLVAEWAATLTSRELNEVLVAAEVAAGSLNNAADILADPQFTARTAFVTHHDEEVGDFVAQGVLPLFSRTPGSVRWSGRWQVGADTEEVLTRAGLTEREIETLRKRSVI